MVGGGRNLDFFFSTYIDAESSALNFKKNCFVIGGRDWVEKSILPNLDFFFPQFLQWF